MDMTNTVAFSNGVYMQIVDRGGKEDKDGVEFINKVDTFANNNVICTRYVEQDMMTGDTTCSMFLWKNGWISLNIISLH